MVFRRLNVSRAAFVPDAMDNLGQTSTSTLFREGADVRELDRAVDTLGARDEVGFRVVELPDGVTFVR